MTPRLYGHPFSSYTWKALIAFHETGAPFEFVELSPDAPAAGEALARLNPFGRFPVLETDEARSGSPASSSSGRTSTRRAARP